MIKKRFLLISLASIQLMASSGLELLSDTKVLKDAPRVQEILKHHGFQKVHFSTPDNVTICGLFLDQSKQHKKPIKGTIIYNAGFYPGTKEGMTSFYNMLHDQPYNFLFFDARGHNESGGSLFTLQGLKDYGKHEYLDVISAIEFIEKYNEEHHLPQAIILHGVCSGAFHNIKALATMYTEQHPTFSLVHGMIIDSGWGDLTEIVEPTITAEIKNYLKDSYFTLLAKPLAYIVTKIYQWGFKENHKKVGSLYDAIRSIHCPTFFIHSVRDPYAPHAYAKRLYDHTPHASAWWEDSDSHTTCCLKKRAEYKAKIVHFLEQIY